MKRFRFPLQSVHNWRESLRDEAERRLGQAIAEVKKAHAKLEEATRARAVATETYLKQLQAGAINPHEIALMSNYLSQVIERETEARRQLMALEEEQETRRLVLAAAARDAEATAKLRERQSERHEAANSRDEQNMHDELATLAAAHRLIQTDAN